MILKFDSYITHSILSTSKLTLSDSKKSYIGLSYTSLSNITKRKVVNSYV